MNSIPILIFIIFVHSVTSIDPGTSLDYYGIYVPTSQIVSKISNGLYRPSRNGIQIRIRGSEQNCLDARVFMPDEFNTEPAVCDRTRATQQWKYLNGQLQPGTDPEITNGTVGPLCLDCTSGAEDCYVEINQCNSTLISQQFYIRVHASQIDIPNNRIYFSVQSGQHNGQCLTSYWSTEFGGQTYILGECDGRVQQSFYLQQDYSQEVQSVKSRVRICGQ